MPKFARGVVLRPARPEDSAALREWRNDHTAYRHFRSAREVTADEHSAWLERVLNDPDVALFIIELDSQPVGNLRLDYTEPDTAELGINVAQAARGRGVGTEAIHLGVVEALKRASRVIAEVFPENAASKAAFERAGFRLSGEHGGMHRYELARSHGAESTAPGDGTGGTQV